MSPHVTLLVVLKTITLLLGGLITYFSYKAYDRSGARPLWYLAVGFAVVTAGLVLSGIIDQAVRLSLISETAVSLSRAGGRDIGTVEVALIVESALTAAGFGIIVYSLYSE